MKKFFGSVFLLLLLTVSFASYAEAQSDADAICIGGVCFYPSAWNNNSGWNTPDDPLTFGGSGSGGNTTGVSVARPNSLQGYLLSFGYFLNYILMPLLFGIALLIFIVNAARYFIIGAGNQDSREKARLLAIYGIAGFVFLVSLWGIVNIFVRGLGLTNNEAMCPDYLGGWCGSASIDELPHLSYSYFNEDT